MTFYLSVKKDGTVVLDCEAHGEIVETIEAETWLEAREKMQTACVHDQGRGFILR